MKENRVRLMAEIGVAVALSAVLNFIPLFKMPYGGSVNLEMLPILIVALRWGGLPGLFTGAVYGFVQLAIDPYVVHPLQMLLDYPLAYMMVGLAGFVPINLLDVNRKVIYGRILAAVILGGMGRFVAHLFTGVIFFGQYAPEGQNPWIYSTLYNLYYIIPSIFISYLIIIPILKRLLKK